ncbi:uncharacterized protein LOC112527873 [Cynara cardunculus var. scolymus]|uniref:uncharacterized protein LOC112527873 n=1 Tax=Cynara cardunculus var. scolymus TaxID=59895 RepID=UPI000D6263A7|nr:uncharacterized protein LOC112527873 [Cynara cardunculus var. scolymus]
MSTAVAVKPVRKFPPPCWTRDEALVLIEAYRERWYALHRAFLRNPDWDAVAEKVTTSCPDVTPPKTSAQCRHKMEKLRQRHRAEKQRASAFPGGRFFSSWFYFEAMEAMENGPNAETGNDNQTNTEINNANAIGTPVLDHQGLNPGRGIRIKPLAVQNLVTLAASSTNHKPDFDSRVSNHNSSYMNNWSNQEDENEDGYFVDSTINETSIHPGYKNHKNSPFTGGIRVKPLIISHPDPRPRKFSKVVHDHEVDDDGEMWIKVPKNTNLFQGNHQNDSSWNPSLNQGKKRGNVGIQEVVSSIKLLGDGFMKMEKMKIDMAREIERMRMETEMKRNQLILESQKQIVDAFVNGLIEIRKQPRTETVADS